MELPGKQPADGPAGVFRTRLPPRPSPWSAKATTPFSPPRPPDEDIAEPVIPLVPRRLHAGLRLLAPLNLALLLVGHLAVTATLRIEGYAPHDAIKPRDASKQNLVNTLVDLVQAEAWLMVLAVGAMSGLWPYIKLLGTYWATMRIDDGGLHRQRWYRCLQALDGLGKWSFADLLLACVNIVVFDISTDEYRVEAVHKLKFDAFMKANLGIVCLSAGIILSALLTAWANRELHAARHSLVSEGAEIAEEENIRVGQLVGGNDWDAQLAGLKKTPGGTGRAKIAAAAVAMFGLLALALTIWGAAATSIHVNRDGVVGNLIREHRHLDLGVLSTASDLRRLSEFRNQPMDLFFADFLLVTALGIPVLQLALLSGGAVAFLKDAWILNRWCHWGADVLRTFDCLDVWLLAVVITNFNLKSVVDFQVASECEAYEEFLDGGPLLTLFGLGFAADKDCLRLIPGIRPGWCMLAAAALLRSVAWQARGGFPSE